jgi:hypothetical protein
VGRADWKNGIRIIQSFSSRNAQRASLKNRPLRILRMLPRPHGGERILLSYAAFLDCPVRDSLR